MATPSWISSVPKNFSYAGAGSLKADEWPIMATVYLPIALVILWGHGACYKRKDMNVLATRSLENTMTLFSAVQLLTLNNMSQGRIQAFRDHIVAYVRDVQALFPKDDIPTNFHMAIHLSNFLKLFGPVWSWWCFPMECLIGIMQQQQTNHKEGIDIFTSNTCWFIQTHFRRTGSNDAANFHKRWPIS